MTGLNRWIQGINIAMWVLFLAQAAYFLGILNWTPELKASELIVSFEGRPERAKEAFRLAEKGLAPAVVISPASLQRLQEFEKQYHTEGRFTLIPEEKARTTFENAYYTREIVRARGIKDLILITSWDHMPRAYMLMKMMLMGTGVTIQLHPVETGKLRQNGWYKHLVGWEMVYNEMMESYGSLVKYAEYRVHGGIDGVEGPPSLVMRWMRRVLLFEIDETVLS